MRIRIFQLLSILVVIFSSCSELDEKNGYIAVTPELHDTIYQARNPNLPCVKTRRIDYGKLMFTRASANEDKNGNLGELLGYSYKIGNTILGDPKNVGYQVIDVTKVTDYEPSLISKNHIGQSSINSFSYASYDDFLQKSQLTKKSKSGFSINVFNIFKIGRKHKNTQVFAAYISDSTRSVYGEANVSFYNSEFKLNSSEGSVGSTRDALPPYGGRFSQVCPRTVLTRLRVYGSPYVTALALVAMNLAMAVCTNDKRLSVHFEHSSFPLSLAFQF